MIFEPPTWGAYELHSMRVLLAVVLAVPAMPWIVLARRQPHPIGVARLVPLTWMSRPRVHRAAVAASLLASVALGAGVLVVPALCVLLFVHVVSQSLLLSQGAVNHGKHAVAVVLLAQLAARISHWIADPGVSGVDRWFLESADATAAWWTVQALVALYLTSGIAKVANSGLLWSSRSPGLVLSVAAQSVNAVHNAFGEVDPSAARARLADRLIAHPDLARLVFSAGLLVELLAPFALIGRGPLVVGGVALYVLHRANQAVLGLGFGLNRYLLVIFFVNVPYLVVELVEGAI